jgi:hypothetical protein
MYEVTMVQLAARDEDKDSGLGIAGGFFQNKLVAL